jgi:microsomal dipeptidase-like Zn-dependent dipeptidase
MRRGLLVVLLLVVALAALPTLVDRALNRVVGSALAPASARAAALFAKLRVVDLHADPLLWQRDLGQRLGHGQVDVPRLIEGNVALQVFGIVTQSPLGQNFERNESDAPDVITLLAVLQRWPRATWASRLARAEHQSAKLAAVAAGSAGKLSVIRTAADLEAFLGARAQSPAQVAGLLGIEGAQALDGTLAGVDALFAAGVRMIGLAHFFDNPVAGSSAGAEKHGLTPLGREVVLRMQALGIALDLAHVSPASVADALALAAKPVVVSHTGVQATCPGPRNLSDEQIRGVAATGGVMGIAYFEGAVCGTGVEHIVRAMRHVKDLVGAEHLALGSDFDGAVATAFDTTALAALVDGLLSDGWNEDEIRGSMGENALRVLGETLPGGTGARGRRDSSE